MARTHPALPAAVLGAALFAAACSPQWEEWYLTAIPEATLEAYTFGSPVETKGEAAVAGMHQVSQPHREAVGTPRVVLVEAVDEPASSWQTPVPGVDDPSSGTIKVWRVVFEGEWRILGPPAPEGFPNRDPPPYHSCAFVMLRAANGYMFLAGDTACPQ